MRGDYEILPLSDLLERNASLALDSSEDRTKLHGEIERWLSGRKTVAEAIAARIEARLNCIARGNGEWKIRHERAVETLCYDHGPSGSGIDAGTKIDWDASRIDRIVLVTAFHHMDQHGVYKRWTDHTVVVTPSLARGFDLRITGENLHEIKDYLHEVYSEWLGSPISAKASVATDPA